MKFSFKHFFRKSNCADSLSLSMQDEIIKIASTRIGKPLPNSLVSKVKQRKWGYMGLEMIIDTVKSIETSEIEDYLSKLD